MAFLDLDVLFCCSLSQDKAHLCEWAAAVAATPSDDLATPEANYTAQVWRNRHVLVLVLKLPWIKSKTANPSESGGLPSDDLNLHPPSDDLNLHPPNCMITPFCFFVAFIHFALSYLSSDPQGLLLSTEPCGIHECSETNDEHLAKSSGRFCGCTSESCKRNMQVTDG